MRDGISTSLREDRETCKESFRYRVARRNQSFAFMFSWHLNNLIKAKLRYWGANVAGIYLVFSCLPVPSWPPILAQHTLIILSPYIHKQTKHSSSSFPAVGQWHRNGPFPCQPQVPHVPFDLPDKVPQETWLYIAVTHFPPLLKADTFYIKLFCCG